MNGKLITSEIRFDNITKTMFNFSLEISYGTSATASFGGGIFLRFSGEHHVTTYHANCLEKGSE